MTLEHNVSDFVVRYFVAKKGRYIKQMICDLKMTVLVELELHHYKYIISLSFQ